MRVTSGGARGGYGSASTLTVRDAEAIRRDAASVAQVSYMIRQEGQVQFGDQNWTTAIQAVTPTYPPITNWRIAAGRGLSDDDVANAALVVVLGQTVYRQLFDEGDDPIGAVVLVKGIPMRVIGLYEGKGQSGMGQDQDDVVMIPFSTGERKIVGVARAARLAHRAKIALYPALPNPYGIRAAPHRIRQRDLRAGHQRGQRADRRSTK